MCSPCKMELKLCSPFGADPISYHWPHPSEQVKDYKERAAGIVDTMRLTAVDFPALKLPLENNILTDYDYNCYDSMKALCDKFNRAVTSIVNLYKGTSFWQRLSKKASRPLLKHIVHQVYCQSVPEPEKLNQYEPFSPEVYGETSFEFICQMIDEINIEREDVFIDLGSGVGQVVVHLAAATSCKLSIGIEKAEVPCAFAERLSENFQIWMNWFGKDFGKYELIRGNFLDSEYKEVINTASIVFVNNFAFGPQVDHKLKERFAELRDGARIISSKAFCPLNFRITDRNLSDIGTIMHVTEMQPLHESVSWTGKPVSYYLHVIDRTKLERYFQRSKQMSNGNGISDEVWSDEDSKKEDKLPNGIETSKEKSDSECSDVPLLQRLKVKRSKNSPAPSDDSTSSKSVPKRILRKRVAKKKDPTPPSQTAKQLPKIKKTKKPKKAMNISGLDLLHSETILSTAGIQNVKLPPPPGCIEHQLNGFYEDDEHIQLPESVYKDLDTLLNSYRHQFVSSLIQMGKRSYYNTVLVEIEKQRKRQLELKAIQKRLEDQIVDLRQQCLKKLEEGMEKLGYSKTDNILLVSQELVNKNTELREKIAGLMEEIKLLQNTPDHLLNKRILEEEDESRTKQVIMEEIIDSYKKRKVLKAELVHLSTDLTFE